MLFFIAVTLWFGSIIFITCQKSESSKTIAKVNGEIITEAEFIKSLPKGFTSDSSEQAYRRELINQIITKKLFVQEAQKLGLDKEIESVFERDQQTILIQALYDDVVTKNVKISAQEFVTAKKLMSTEVRLKLISVANKDILEEVSGQIKKGVEFDTLAKDFSQDPSGRIGGDIGFVPILYFEESVRKAILKMKPGEISEPIQGSQDYKIINYLEKRASSEPIEKITTDARKVLEQEKSLKLATAYLDKMQSRLEYNPEGLRVFYKNVTQITPEEAEIWVVQKDNKKIVKAKNLLHVAREFPNLLDTLMRTYAIKRAIEEDVLYEDAINRRLDKKPDIAQQLAMRKEDLLYEKFFLAEITQKINITDKDIADYYQTHKAKYEPNKLSEVMPIIRNTILSEQRQHRYQTIADSLRSQAQIEINEKLVRTAGKVKENHRVKSK